MMNYLAERQQDAYLRELAEYFASQQLPFDSSRHLRFPLQQLARGLELVKEGDRSTDVPACSACHGAKLLGALPRSGALGSVPFLSGRAARGVEKTVCVTQGA